MEFYNATFNKLENSSVKKFSNSLPIISGVILSFIILGCSWPRVKSPSSNNSLSSLIQMEDYKSLPSQKIQFPAYKVKELSNGLKIIYVKEERIPSLTLMYFNPVGVLGDPKDQLGLNSFMAELMAEGTLQRSSPELKEELGFLGADFSVSPGDEFTTFTMDGLWGHKKNLLELFYEILSKPRFDEKDFERSKKNLQISLDKRKEDASGWATLEFLNWFGQNHSLLSSQEGSPESVDKIQLAQIKNHYESYYGPKGATLVVIGKVESSFEAEVESLFKAWRVQKKNHTDLKSLSLNPVSESFKVFRRPNLKQTEIRMGFQAIPRNHEEALTLRLANLIFGGGFTSRLNSKIRDDLGLTYSIHSSVNHKKDLGYLTISTFTKNESVQKVLNETWTLVDEFSKNGVSLEEVENAKSLLKGQFPLLIETSTRFATNLVILDFYGINSGDYLTTFQDKISKITKDDVNKVIKNYWKPEKLKTYVYTDEKVQVKSQF